MIIDFGFSQCELDAQHLHLHLHSRYHPHLSLPKVAVDCGSIRSHVSSCLEKTNLHFPRHEGVIMCVGAEHDYEHSPWNENHYSQFFLK